MDAPSPETLEAFNSIKTALEILVVGALLSAEWTREVLPNAQVSVTFNSKGLPARVELGYRDSIPSAKT